MGWEDVFASAVPEAMLIHAEAIERLIHNVINGQARPYIPCDIDCKIDALPERNPFKLL